MSVPRGGFSDSHVADGQTQVVCSNCYYVLSVHCVRQDLTVMHDQLETIAKKIHTRIG